MVKAVKALFAEEGVQSRLPFWSTALAIAGASFALAASAASARDDYSPTITEREREDLLAGEKLDREDVVYCEKARDVCLAAICGTTEKRNAQPACWEHCTETAYNACKAEE